MKVAPAGFAWGCHLIAEDAQDLGQGGQVRGTKADWLRKSELAAGIGDPAFMAPSRPGGSLRQDVVGEPLPA